MRAPSPKADGKGRVSKNQAYPVVVAALMVLLPWLPISEARAQDSDPASLGREVSPQDVIVAVSEVELDLVQVD